MSRRRIIHLLQYLIAFATGAIAPYFIGGIASSIIAVNLWASQPEGMSNPAPSVISLITAVTFTAVCLVYLVFFLALAWVLQHFGPKPTVRGVALGSLAAGGVILLAVMGPYIFFQLGGSQSIYLDMAILALYGSGYVLGWWVIRRYAKLEK